MNLNYMAPFYSLLIKIKFIVSDAGGFNQEKISEISVLGFGG